MLLATAATAVPRGPTDQIALSPRGELLELSWSDAEERLQGSIRPAIPREGEPLQVVIQLGSFEGPPFEGPLLLTLREAGATHGQTLTVARGERHWQATFTPERAGPHLLDVGFRTTRHKVLHAPLQVEGSRVPRMLGWGVLGLAILALLGYSVRNVLRGEHQAEQSPEPSGESPPSSESR